MATIIILSTCDEWKSYASFQLYGTWATTKASCRRLYKTIIEGIRNDIFAYEDESLSREEQIITFQEDEKRESATTFFETCRTNLYTDISNCPSLDNPYPAPGTALRWFDSIGGITNHNLSIFCLLAAAVREDSDSTTPTTARRGTRFELLDGRRGYHRMIRMKLIYPSSYH